MKDVKALIGTAVFGLVAAILVIMFQDIGAAGTMADRMMILSNGCFVAGVLLLSAGLLNWAAREGSFDMLVYGVKTVASLLHKNYKERLEEDYYTYTQKKREQREQRVFNRNLLFVGVFYILLGAVFTVLFYQYYNG